MKKFHFIFILLFMLVMSNFSCGKIEDEPLKNYEREECKILAVGDVHIVSGDQKNINNFKNTLYFALEEKYDVILFNGDLISYATNDNYEILDSIFEEVFGSVDESERPEFLFNMGNHEYYANSSCRHQDTDYDRETSKFRTFASKWMKEEITDNVYYRKIKGVSFVLACPGPERKDGSYYLAGLGEYSENDLKKIESLLAELTKDGDAVILSTHNPWGYTYGGKYYRVIGEPILSKYKSMLSKYPSVINLTSHTHFTSLHERSFDQTDYTSINIGPHSNGKYVSQAEFDEYRDLIDYYNIENYNLVNDAKSLSLQGASVFGLELNFGKDEININRVSLSKKSIYPYGSWSIPYNITSENKHDKFYYEKGERSGETLSFSDNGKLDVSAAKEGKTAKLTIKFEDVEKFYAVEGYKIEISGSDDSLIKKIFWQSLFWADLGEKSTYEITLNDLTLSSSYKVEIYPLDFFGHYGEEISATVNLNIEQSEEEKKEEESGDLLFTSSIAKSSYDNETYFVDRLCLDTSSASSGYSLKLSCNSDGDGWPGIKFKLDESVDLTTKSISFDAKFIDCHKWISVKLYDSKGNYVCGEIGTDVKEDGWSTIVIDNSKLKTKLLTGFNLSDVLYIEFYVNFDKAKGHEQTIYVDNLKIN